VITFFRVVSRYSPAAQQRLLTNLKLLNVYVSHYIADVIQLKSYSYTACLQFQQTLSKAACDAQQTAVRTNFHTQRNYEENQTTLVFRMVHGTNSLVICDSACVRYSKWCQRFQWHQLAL